MVNSTTTCSFNEPVYWNGPDLQLKPLDSTLASGGSFAYAEMKCATAYANSTSTDVSVYNGFSYADIVLSVFLFIIMTILVYNFIWFSVNKLKVKFRK